MKETNGIYVGKNPFAVDLLDMLNRCFPKTNNWLKMHGKPMRRKSCNRKKRCNVVIIGSSGSGRSFVGVATESQGSGKQR